jgi:hypothetical protein
VEAAESVRPEPEVSAEPGIDDSAANDDQS